jgi:hypothetical protein
VALLLSLCSVRVCLLLVLRPGLQAAPLLLSVHSIKLRLRLVLVCLLGLAQGLEPDALLLWCQLPGLACMRVVSPGICLL